MFNYQDFGLEQGNLYEIIATTYSITRSGKEIKRELRPVAKNHGGYH